jgi:hypothetical protein
MQPNIPRGATRVLELDEAWNKPLRGVRLRAVRSAAERVRERFASGPRAVSVRTLPLTTLAYPTRYAFGGFAFSPVPFVIMTHRCALLQFMQNGALKTLLFNPTDIDAARATPFFARLLEEFGPTLSKLLAKSYERLEDQLAKLGIGSGDVDYVAFDHFHTQDLRSLLGTDDGAYKSRFPNAVLLAPKNEWEDWDDLHPYQRAWFVRDGKRGVKEDRVCLTSGDYVLGDGIMILRTPGHTSGNQTLFVNTDQGVWGISENGTCADNWSPHNSRIAGLAFTCKKQDLDLVVNSNTPEGGADQYTSMALERAIVDRVRRAPAFVQMFPSSEVTPTLTAPGLSPTLLHRSISFGEVARPGARTPEAHPSAARARPAPGVDA